MANFVYHWNNFTQLIGWHRSDNHVGVSSSGSSAVESEGRVWVEVGDGSDGAAVLKLRVTHLHPSNPAIARVLREQRRLVEAGGIEQLEEGESKTHLPPDKVSLSSQEDFWFNHWQGPSITPCDTRQPVGHAAGQQSTGLQRTASVRKSTRRCSTCNRKVGVSTLPLQPPDSPVLAHLPSLKRGLSVPPAPAPASSLTPDDPADSTSPSDQDHGTPSPSPAPLPSNSLSRQGSEEHLARAQRVLEHEQRTSLKMFACDAVDGPDASATFTATTSNTSGSSGAGNSGINNRKTSFHTMSGDHNMLELPAMPWRQSKSCPCSPKINRKRQHRVYSPTESPTNSPKSTKFSFGGSLLAIHRQASNSLRGDFFKIDGISKSDPAAGSNLKNRSLQNSIKLKKQKSHCSIYEEENSSIISEEELSEISTQSSCTKKPIRESHSLPVLKLSRMSLSYRAGSITKSEKDTSPFIECDESSPEPQSLDVTAGACGFSETLKEAAHNTDAAVAVSVSLLLPDLIPKTATSSTTTSVISTASRRHHSPPVAAVSPFMFTPTDGVINLGFDGESESSDFTENKLEPSISTAKVEIRIDCSNDEFIKSGTSKHSATSQNSLVDSIPQIHGMSLGHLSSEGNDIITVDVPPNSSQMLTEFAKDGHILDMQFNNSSDTNLSSLTPSVSSIVASNFSTAPSTAPCSPSALRIRVMDGKSPPRPTVVVGPVSNINTAKKRKTSSGTIATALKDNSIRNKNEENVKVNGTVERRGLLEKISAGVGNLSGRKTADSGNDAGASAMPGGAIQEMNILDATRRDGMLEGNTGTIGEVRKDVDEKGERLVEEEEEEQSNLAEARAMVYWWQKDDVSLDDDEDGDEGYCLYQDDCRKKRPLLLFVHGVGGSADDWHHQLWYFVAAGYEVVAPDLLGHGYSSAPYRKSCYRFPRLLDHLRLLFDLFVPPGRKCVLVGHGYGCALVAALSRCRPASVPLLVLASCGGPAPLLPAPSPGGYPSPSTSACSPCCPCADTITDAVTEAVSQCWEVVYGEQGCSTSAGEDVGWGGGVMAVVKGVVTTTCLLMCCLPCFCVKRQAVYQARGKQLCGGALATAGATATPRYVLNNVMRGQRWPDGDMAFHRRITVPVLLLHGLRDETVPLVHMCEMEKTIPRAFLEVLGSAGHQLMTEAPRDVSAALHRFLTRWEKLT